MYCLVPWAGICKPELIGECVSFKWGCYLVFNIRQVSVISISFAMLGGDTER